MSEDAVVIPINGIETTVERIIQSNKNLAEWLEGVGHQSLCGPDDVVIIPDALAAGRLLRMMLPPESRA